MEVLSDESMDTSEDGNLDSKEEVSEVSGPQIDLPEPVPVSPNSLVKVGKVLSIVDTQVVIESMKSMPPLDLDTVLFKINGSPIGYIYDVFGPITCAHYSVKFSSSDKIKENEIQKDTEVFFVPQTDRTLTKFAFVNELRKLKGSDASWEYDREPPEDVIEYSDDEEEAIAKRNLRRARQQARALKPGGL